MTERDYFTELYGPLGSAADDDDDEDRSIVPDGGSTRVPLYLMDGTSQPARSEVAPTQDAARTFRWDTSGVLQRHRPGWRQQQRAATTDDVDILDAVNSLNAAYDALVEQRAPAG
jgi:hypothetical protein